MSTQYLLNPHSIRVKVSDEALAFIVSKCRKSDDVETGGILIGKYSPDGILATVDEAWEPPQGSEASPTRFVRGDNGLASALEQRWTSEQYYLGEWHFHPKGLAHPSSQDRRQMALISRDSAYSCSKPILILVGHASSWETCVWVFEAGELHQLQEEV